METTNFRVLPVFTGSSDFAIELQENEQANLEVLGYGIRLTKSGKAVPELSLMGNGNLSEADEAKVRQLCAQKGIPVNGQKGCALYQVTGYKNVATGHQFVNTFVAPVPVGQSFTVKCVPQIGADKQPILNSQNKPYLTITHIAEKSDTSNADLTKKQDNPVNAPK